MFQITRWITGDLKSASPCCSPNPNMQLMSECRRLSVAQGPKHMGKPVLVLNWSSEYSTSDDGLEDLH